jgi:hypothetical protein
VFTFIPESCSGSPRNTVRNHPGIAFTFLRIPQFTWYARSIDAYDRTLRTHPEKLLRGRRTAYQKVAGLAARIGDPARASAAAGKELEIDRQMLEKDPKDVNAQLNQGLAFLQIGQSYEARAGRTGSRSDWRQADAWDRKSIEAWERIQKEGHLNPRYAVFLAQARASIAKCKKVLGEPQQEK